MSGHCAGCGTYHEEDDSRLCRTCESEKKVRLCKHDLKELHMKPSDLPPDQILKLSLFGTVCPTCGAWKRQKATLCFSCYGTLPKALKSRLYSFFGHGYQEALASAITHIHERTQRRSVFWPEPQPKEEVFPL